MVLVRSKGSLLFCFILLFCFSCKKEKSTETPATSVLTTGTWFVSNMTEAGVDNTYMIEEYSFIFNTNGELTATCIYGTTVGSWYAEDDNSEMYFRLALGNAEPLIRLSKRWHVRSQTVTEVVFYDDDHQDYEVTLKKQ